MNLRKAYNYTFVRMNAPRFFLLLVVVVATALLSCQREDSFKTSGIQLKFSTDTLTFDTVFTQLGSVTKRFKVLNPYDEPVKIERIQIKNEAALGETMFRMNVDGKSGSSIPNLEIAANDSAFIFIEVTVDPVNQDNPLVIFDAVEFITQNNVQEVTLEAWGQDAYYYVPNTDTVGLPAYSSITDYGQYFPVGANIDLPNNKPHVIFGYLRVDNGVQLTIPEGTQIHLFKGAGLWVAKNSSIQVNGEPDNEVVFQGTRLEEFYDDVPGQWDRIWINESNQNSSFKHAIIKNGFIGIQAELFPFSTATPAISPNQLTLENTQIKNMDGIGVLSRNYNVLIQNSLITNSQNQLFAVQGGGDVQILHSTLANYWPYGGRSNSSFFATNGYVDFNEIERFLDLDIRVENSIVYGTNREEIEIDSLAGSTFEYSFSHSVLKTEIDSNSVHFVESVVNPLAAFGFIDPLFANPGNDEFELFSNSKAIDVGSVSLTGVLTTDLKGDTRDSNPDAGCYEYVP